jgi:uncharacterized phiE125 gp8 family phage protein
MTLRLITAPVDEPVSIETAKSFLRVDHSNDDTLIASLVKAAREKGEDLARRAFITQTLEQIFDEWPSDGVFALWRPPLQSVTSIKYTDSDAVEHTLSASDYTVDINSQPGQVWIDNVPSDELTDSGGIVVRFVAGYGVTAASVPERIKIAILSLVAYWYETRDIGNIPSGVNEMFVGERVVWF